MPAASCVFGSKQQKVFTFSEYTSSSAVCLSSLRVYFFALRVIEIVRANSKSGLLEQTPFLNRGGRFPSSGRAYCKFADFFPGFGVAGSNIERAPAVRN